MEIIVVVSLLGLLIPLGIWFADEARGRAGWLRETRIDARFDLGGGAFRETHLAVTHTEVTQTRAPWWVRLVALTCYLPSGVALVAGVPWCVGLLILTDHHNQNDLGASANGMLILAYPFGCWAAVRMAALGRALLSGDGARFRATLQTTAALQIGLNGALLLGALGILLTYRRQEALGLFIAPLITLAQLALVGSVGLRQTRTPE